MFLTKEQILAADDLAVEEVDIPQWGGKVRIRTLTAGERDEFELDVFGSGEKPNLRDMRAKLLALTLIDPQGERLFAYDEVVKLTKKSAAVMDMLFDKAQALNRMSRESVVEAEKN